VSVRSELRDAPVAGLTVHDSRFVEGDQREGSDGDARVDAARDEYVPPRRDGTRESEVRTESGNEVAVPRRAADVKVLRPGRVSVLDRPWIGVVLRDAHDLEGVSLASDRRANRLELRLVPANDVGSTVEREKQVEREHRDGAAVVRGRDSLGSTGQ